jgi:hypothetical protein
MFQGESRQPGAMLTFFVSGSEADGMATLEILDPERSVIRTVETPVRAGMNRVTWDLREEGDPEAAAWGMSDWSPGLEVLPGLYQVRLRVAGGESSRQLHVLPDPRSEIPMVERIQKRQALERGLELGRAFIAFQQRRVTLHQELGRIRELLASRRDDEAQSLREGLEAVWEAIEQISYGLWEAERQRSTVFGMASTRDAPTEAEHIALYRMEEGLDGVIREYNALLAGRIANFRRAVQDAGIGDFLELEYLPGVSGG